LASALLAWGVERFMLGCNTGLFLPSRIGRMDYDGGAVRSVCIESKGLLFQP
jgi:hypothetical protein